MIRRVNQEDIPLCTQLIRESFKTVADQFGFTQENAPGFTAFITTEDRLYWQLEEEHRPMYLYCDEDGICGYYSLMLQENNACELNNLAVSPEYRHKGIGKKLLEHAFNTAKDLGCTTMNIEIIEENKVVRKWYEANGAIYMGTRKYDALPFMCGHMEKKIDK